jgi:allantoicase
VLLNVNNPTQAQINVSEHFAKYFKQKRNAEADEDEYIFDWDELRLATRSFIDSIVIELCFPRAPYPQNVLYEILRDAIDESPKDAKLFPQTLWDAVGDYSVQKETFLSLYDC